MVDSLISPENREWDIDFLKPFLKRSELDAILKTHIGDNLLRDRLVWPFEKKRGYIRLSLDIIGQLLKINPLGALTTKCWPPFLTTCGVVCGN